MTEVLPVNPTAPEPALIARAAECLRAGGLVAFPTETVYGLGAHALDVAAVSRVFAVKGRPPSDPLIVHVADRDDLEGLVAHVSPLVDQLAQEFWPGPLTLVLPRSPNVPSVVTAGGDTVAVRVPSHPVAQALLRSARIPVAAPSANVFSRPSPTRVEHVLHDLDDRIDLVLDAGPTTVGLESTVVDLTDERPRVLRPGAVTLEMLRPFLPDVSMSVSARTPFLRSPGLLEKHYAPQAPLTLYEGAAPDVVMKMAADARAAAARGQRVGVLVSTDLASHFREIDAMVAVAGDASDATSIARRLYAALRELDAAGVDVILASGLAAAEGLSVAIRDRLRRAAAGRIVHT